MTHVTVREAFGLWTTDSYAVAATVPKEKRLGWKLRNYGTHIDSNRILFLELQVQI